MTKLNKLSRRFAFAMSFAFAVVFVSFGFSSANASTIPTEQAQNGRKLSRVSKAT
ncbi:MAG: hypothetical protein LBP35_02080 [Candidatus Ancillula trichonymphae]|jgi:hypothetical protein|nr:hypothetical protein [Candidatus Ancillula trichonymphae]